MKLPFFVHSFSATFLLMQSLRYFFLVAGLVAASALVLHAQSDNEKYARVKIDLTGRQVAEVAALGLEADHGQYAPGRFLINDYSESEIALLHNAGFPLEILIPDVQAHYANPNRGHVDARGPGLCDDAPATGSVRNYPVPQYFTLGSMAGFYTYQEMLDVLDEMQQRFPHLISARDTIPNGFSYEGRPIYWLRVSDNPDVDENNEPEVLYTALHHAREPNSLTQLIFYLWYLLENYETNPEIQHLLNNTELYVIPCINPDGYIFNQTNNPDGGGMWRKNRRPNADGAFGVDLNRNYGFQWGFDDIGSSPAPGSDVYRGAAGFSEPETQAIRDFCLQHQFRIALNHHTFGNLLVYPWGYSDSATPDAATFSALAQAMTLENNFRAGTGTETVGYVVNGSSDDWMYGQAQIFGMTPELGVQSEGFWPALNNIIPNSQSCVWMNLVAANAVHNFGLATAPGDAYLTPNTAAIPVRVARYGLAGGSFTVTLSSLAPQLAEVSGSPITLQLEPNQTLDTSFALTLAPNLQPGQEMLFLLTIDNGHYLRTDTVRRFFYNFQDPTFEDNFNSIANWQTTNTAWGLTPARFFSAPNSLADSPNGQYPNNNLNRIDLNQPIAIDEAETVLLFFRATWDIEAFYDYAQLQVRVNNGAFIPVCGKYTHPGSDFQDLDQPIYDGIQPDWVLEEINLSNLVQPGDEIRLRFLLGSDAFQRGDGFFVDDLAIYQLAPDSSIVSAHHPDPADFTLTAAPNPARDQVRLQLQGSANPPAAALVILYDARGREVARRQLLPAPNTTDFYFSTQSLPNGLYALHLTTPDGQSASLKIAIAK